MQHSSRGGGGGKIFFPDTEERHMLCVLHCMKTATECRTGVGAGSRIGQTKDVCHARLEWGASCTNTIRAQGKRQVFLIAKMQSGRKRNAWSVFGQAPVRTWRM